MRRVLLVRHGETDSNQTGIWQCQHDIPLNERGIRQAEDLARNFNHIDVSGIFSSDMTRAIETARILENITGIRYLGSSSTLRERGCGEISGLDYFGIERKFGIKLTSILSRELDMVPGAEKFEIFASRVEQAINDIFRKASGMDVCVVTHGGVMAYAHQWLSGTEELKRFGNCENMWIGLNGGNFVEIGKL